MAASYLTKFINPLAISVLAGIVVILAGIWLRPYLGLTGRDTLVFSGVCCVLVLVVMNGLHQLVYKAVTQNQTLIPDPPYHQLERTASGVMIAGLFFILTSLTLAGFAIHFYSLEKEARLRLARSATDRTAFTKRATSFYRALVANRAGYENKHLRFENLDVVFSIADDFGVVQHTFDATPRRTDGVVQLTSLFLSDRGDSTISIEESYQLMCLSRCGQPDTIACPQPSTKRVSIPGFQAIHVNSAFDVACPQEPVRLEKTLCWKNAVSEDRDGFFLDLEKYPGVREVTVALYVDRPVLPILSRVVEDSTGVSFVPVDMTRFRRVPALPGGNRGDRIKNGWKITLEATEWSGVAFLEFHRKPQVAGTY